MLPIIIICGAIIVLMLIAIVKFPVFTLKHHEFQTFWIIPFLGVITLILFHFISLRGISDGLLSNSSVNPIKILLLFFSMTFISICLDELGFFDYLAHKALQKTKTNQFSLFIILYLLTSILTIFTSNDIIILTFTPFIIFFTKSAKINPLPYLISEFIGANTWSMFLIIGNPTNIYLGTSGSLSFMSYSKVMFLPTLLAGIISFIIIFLLFHKEFKKPMTKVSDIVTIKNPGLLIINLIILSICTITLVVSSYINIEMYQVSLTAALVLFLIILFYSINKKNYIILTRSIKRLPWSLIPFVLSMFIIVLTLKENGITNYITKLLSNNYPILTYGITSTIVCNLINNIPMSVLYSEIIPINNLSMLYSTIIGSNIGAFLTPIGALAGIMWLSILKKYEIKLNFLTFIKYGIIIAIPTLLFSLLGLMIVL